MLCKCGKEVEPARIELLNSDICAECAKRSNPPRVKGLMIYDDKTAPTIQVMSPQVFERLASLPSVGRSAGFTED